MGAVRFCFFLLFFGLGLASCQPSGNSQEKVYLAVEGPTMGTYYRVTYSDAQSRNFQPDIEALLKEINGEISTYDKNSTISRFNQADKIFRFSLNNKHFLACLEKSKEIYEKSEGAFDPTVMPLVNYWGFGYKGDKPVSGVDSAKIDSLLPLVGFVQVGFRKEGDSAVLEKPMPGVELDFGGIGQGYGIDAISWLLDEKGVKNYLVDIGGEMVSKGKNPDGKVWRVGINVPLEDAPLDDIQTAVPLDEQAVSTSGNYRKYFEVAGVKYSHEINPKTGFPERSPLLSASVFAKDCTTADGYATACMIMGLEKSLAMAERLPEIEVFLIYSDDKGNLQTAYSKGLQPLFKDLIKK